MPLTMARPWKHPKTGIYWLRRAVPDDLRTLVGKREEKRTLATRDPAEARSRHAAAMAELEARWANLRGGARTLTEVEAHALAGRVHAEWLELHRDEPSAQRYWRCDAYAWLWSEEFEAERADPDAIPAEADPDGALARILAMERWCAGEASVLLQDTGLVVDAAGRGKLERAVAAASQRACLLLQRWASGELEAQDGPTRRPASRERNAPAPAVAPAVAALSFDEALELWEREKRPSAKTVYDWRRLMAQFAAHLGHADAHRLTPDDLIGWKAALVAAGLHPKTIRNARLGAVRAVLQCAVDNRRLATNPAERIGIDVKAAGTPTRRSFTDGEAALVLRAALRETNPVLRWAPWLCAYSGARVSEVCQLRREDVHEHEGVWCMRIAAEAGSLKNANSERAVPLHPALIERGFLGFVATVRDGPLFAKLPPDKFGKRGGNGTKVLSRWVRELGLTDERLAPNHSWRHRFKTLGRRHGLATDLTNAMTGHGRRTVADVYGEYPMAALLREISKIPTLALE